MRSPASRTARYVILTAVFVAAVAALHARNVHGAAHDAHAMSAHMTMTPLRPIQPGDKERAAAVAAAARTAADQYTDYKRALADGYTIFHPEIKQDVYHFTNNRDALAATINFDPAKPTSLLYERVPGAVGVKPGYKLVGVMYTAPYRDTEAQLDARVPLSITQWHLHTNLCLPPSEAGLDTSDLNTAGAKFGLQGSIATAEACKAAGGQFIPHLFGWMVHVYPYEKDPAKIWATGMDDDHGMDHDSMPMGMKM